MYYHRLLSLFLLFYTNVLFSQQQKDNYLKGNALLASFGIANVGYEHQLNHNKTLEIDALYSPWKSIEGNHAEALILSIEGRHFFDKAFNKWYVGGHIGGSRFNLTKWHYWNRNLYQEGYSYMIGLTVGYEYKWKDKWLIDIHIGGGTVQSFYKGYLIDKETGQHTRYEHAKNFNKSGEIVPYKLGIMIGYKL